MKSGASPPKKPHAEMSLGKTPNLTMILLFMFITGKSFRWKHLPNHSVCMTWHHCMSVHTRFCVSLPVICSIVSPLNSVGKLKTQDRDKFSCLWSYRYNKYSKRAVTTKSWLVVVFSFLPTVSVVFGQTTKKHKVLIVTVTTKLL